MGNFVSVVKESEREYIGITDKPFSKVLGIEKKLNLHRFAFEGTYTNQIIYFDTESNLLEKAGIILSKIIEPNKTYFKIERHGNLPRNFSRKNEKIFVHEVGVKDSVVDHAFFLTDGIKALFTIQFTIDFENVLKNVFPTMIIESKNTVYKVLSGGGFSSHLHFCSSVIKNTITKRQFPVKTLSVKLTSPATQMNAFNYFNEKIEKYCKELVPFNESMFEYAKRVTKPLPKKEKLTKEQKQALKAKKKKIEDVILG